MTEPTDWEGLARFAFPWAFEDTFDREVGPAVSNLIHRMREGEEIRVEDIRKYKNAVEVMDYLVDHLRAAQGYNRLDAGYTFGEATEAEIEEWEANRNGPSE